MNLSEYARAMAGRRSDRSHVPPESRLDPPRPVAERAAAPFETVDDGAGAWIPAGLVVVHDEVNVAGEWLTVTGPDKTPADFDRLGSVVLHFGARVESTDYMALVYARDEATIIGEQLRGAR